MERPRHEDRWTGRPRLTRGIRVFVVLVPFAASVGFAWGLSAVLPSVSSLSMALARWLLIAVVSTLVMVAIDRLARRLLPLAALLSLTLAFPDQAPSRFKIAMRTGTTLQLRKLIADARDGKVGTTPAEAAEKLLELVAALSLHDRLTRGHSERVRAYTHMIGDEMGVTGTELDRLRWAGLLHDIGKLLVPAEILNKPGRLTDAEFAVVKEHPELGRRLVAPLAGWLGDSTRAVWEHHERWDGGGYPMGLAGTDIGFAGRVVAVADAFDVMTSARSYKDPMPAVDARAELARCAGTQFDAAVVRAFLNLSLGRLRMAMGPLSWLTQLSFVPQSLASVGASGATAITAVVGLGAGALGASLSDDGPFTRSVHAAPAVAVVDGNELPATVGVRGEPGSVATPRLHADDGGEPDATTPATVTDTIAPATTAPRAPTSTLRAPSVGDAPTPTTAPGGATPRPGAPTTVPSGAVTVPGGSATTIAAPTGGTTATTTPIPTTTTSAPPTTAPATTVLPAPATTVPPATTTTVPPAPLADTVLYLTSPGSGSLASRPVLPLATPLPLAVLLVPNYDTDRNDDPGLTLEHDAPARSEQRFRWAAGQAVRVHGTVEVILYATGRNNAGSFVLDVRLRSCRGTACTDVSFRRAAGNSPFLVGYASMTFDLGAIDTVLAAGDELELSVTAPPDAGRHVWLAYDTLLTASHLAFRVT